jgi:hypothetical protein
MKKITFLLGLIFISILAKSQDYYFNPDKPVQMTGGVMYNHSNYSGNPASGFGMWGGINEWSLIVSYSNVTTMNIDSIGSKTYVAKPNACSSSQTSIGVAFELRRFLYHGFDDYTKVNPILGAGITRALEDEYISGTQHKSVDNYNTFIMFGMNVDISQHYTLKAVIMSGKDTNSTSVGLGYRF